MIDYGAKGCRCYRSEDYNFWDDRTHGEYLPNAACPHHGLLADYTERKDTGVYTVITKPVTIEPRQDLSTPLDGPECPPGVHSMFDFCPGGCLNECGANPMDCPGPAEDGTCLSPTTEEERRGVAVRATAAVRRWARRAGDWLDPHAEHRREYRRLLAEWRRRRD